MKSVLAMLVTVLSVPAFGQSEAPQSIGQILDSGPVPADVLARLASTCAAVFQVAGRVSTADGNAIKALVFDRLSNNARDAAAYLLGWTTARTLGIEDVFAASYLDADTMIEASASQLNDLIIDNDPNGIQRYQRQLYHCNDDRGWLKRFLVKFNEVSPAPL
jgi:hypothetical protein